MKKLVSLLLAIIFSGAVLTACNPESTTQSENSGGTEQVTFRIAGLKGPTTMGMVGMMNDFDNGLARHNYEVTMYGTADEIVPKLATGEIDVAALPCNLASVLFAQTDGKVQMAAVNTLGVLYIVETGNSIYTVEDLRGKTIYAAGKGTVPEYVLQYILEKNGLVIGTDVFVEYKSEATEVANLLAEGENIIAMLPQPYATTVQMQNDTVRTALNLSDEWGTVSDGSALITGVLVVRKEFAEQNPQAMQEFLEDYEISIRFVNNDIDTAAVLVAHYDIAPEAVAEMAIPLCNITYIDGAEMKEKVAGYLEVLYNQNPKAVGGSLPSNEFYYQP